MNVLAQIGNRLARIQCATVGHDWLVLEYGGKES
jgi:hypothetical protein